MEKKRHIIFKERTVRLITDFLTEMTKTKSQVTNILACLKTERIINSYNSKTKYCRSLNEIKIKIR